MYVLHYYSVNGSDVVVTEIPERLDSAVCKPLYELFSRCLRYAQYGTHRIVLFTEALQLFYRHHRQFRYDRTANLRIFIKYPDKLKASFVKVHMYSQSLAEVARTD